MTELHCSGPTISIWIRAMGWLFGCFGRGRRDRLPTLCSRSSRHQRREYYKAQDRAPRLPSSLRSGRPLLTDAKPIFCEQEGAPDCGTQDETKLWSRVDKCKDERKNIEEVVESEQLREEVCHLRSCGISLHTPDELRKISPGTATRSWHSWLDPSFSPVAKIQLHEVENVERRTGMLPFQKEPTCESLSSGDAGKFMQFSCDSGVTAEQVVYDVVNADKSSNSVALQESSTPDQIVEAQSALASDKVKPELDTGVDTSKGVLEKESQVCSKASGLLKAVPSASAGFFMFPRKRSVGYRSFVWQEPLSPVAEADSSLSSEEEENGIHTTSVTPAQLEGSGSSEDGAGSIGSQSGSPSSCQRNVPPSPDVKSDGSDVEVAPVQCSSPTINPIIQKGCQKMNEEAMLNQNGHAEKENRPANNCTPGKLEDNAGRQNQASVLTPVGNLLQWKQLKEDSAPKGRLFDFEANMLGSGLSHEGRYTETTDNAADEVVLEVDAENYYFFKEVQQTSTEISPQIRPVASAAASRWSGCSVTPLWDGQGIPNSTRKYKEDQVVTWHSTPFDVRVDKALAFQVTEVPQRELFRY